MNLNGSKLPTTTPPRWWKRVLAAWQLLKNPPDATKVHINYNTLRQEYILERIREHYKKRDDDPAPLFEKTLLDVGCGLSTVNGFMTLSGATVTAIDPDPEILNGAEQQAKAEGLPIIFRKETIEQHVVASQNKYDVILALDVLEHVKDPKKFIWAINQLLKPNGILILATINRTWKAWLLHVVLSEWWFHRSTSHRHHTSFQKPEHLRKLLHPYNLTPILIQGLWFNVEDASWRLSPWPDTRYIATIVKT